jgi:hypothetical protein
LSASGGRSPNRKEWTMKLVQVIAAMAIAGAAQAQPGAPAGGAAPQPQVPGNEQAVKRLYLVCDAESSQRLLDADEGAYCSAVAERLLRHYFKGDLSSLLAWWRGEKAARVAAAGGAEGAAGP